MKQTVIIVFLILAMGCTSSKKEQVVQAPVKSFLPLETALSQSADLTLEQLKSEITVPVYEDLLASDPIKKMPPELFRSKSSSSDVNEEKKLKRIALNKVRKWSASRKLIESEKILADAGCGQAIEMQALAFMLEREFPEALPVERALKLHERVIACPGITSHESRFRLSAFLIQQGHCDQALPHLKAIPVDLEQGVLDRASYMSSLCGEKPVVNKINPLGGYGVLLLGSHVQVNEKAEWGLSVHSGDENWDRLLASLIELKTKERISALQHVTSRLNPDAFKGLPLQFKASVWYLMSSAGLDLQVFQTLHPFLAENPNMISASALKLLFPVRYWQEIVGVSDRVDPILVKSLIRQESAFNPQARSPAKATGLMQLLYSTAKIFGVSKKVELTQPEKNLKAGSKFLASLIEDFGSPELALAAYNAGPGKVREWQKRYPTDNMELFVEMIPFSETREYVRLVNRNYQMYQNLLMKPQVLGKASH